jgi:hypothetical protein
MNLVIMTLLAGSLFAQKPQYPYFTALYEASPSGAAVATSLQQPATATRAIRIVGAQLYCSVACTITLEAAAAATATESTAISKMPGQTENATARFFTASNAVAPSVAINKYVVAAGNTMTVTFTEGADEGDTVGALPRIAGLNYTLRTSSITGDVKITWFWREE